MTAIFHQQLFLLFCVSQFCVITFYFAFSVGIITKDEFSLLSTQSVDDYINTMVREHPRFRQRYSEQTYLPMSKSFSNINHVIRERYAVQ